MAKLKVIQLNLWHGTYLREAAAFLKRENPDIILLQEVAIGAENRAPDIKNQFEFLKHELGMDGVFAPSHALTNDAQSQLGNAVLTKERIISTHTLWLRPFAKIPLEIEKRDIPAMPRNALDCTIELKETELHAISVHSAWTQKPVDTPEKIRQAKLLAEYIKQLEGQPFILGGDFNMPPGSKTIDIISSVARDAVTHPPSRITHTINYALHPSAAEMPGDLKVDFIFTPLPHSPLHSAKEHASGNRKMSQRKKRNTTVMGFASPHFTVSSIIAPQVNISDHLPVCASLTFHERRDDGIPPRLPKSLR